MHTALDMIDDAVDELNEHTTKGLTAHKNALWRRIDNHFTQYRNELMADSMKKLVPDEDPAMREKNLHDQLELMTHMAQELDKNHLIL